MSTIKIDCPSCGQPFRANADLLAAGRIVVCQNRACGYEITPSEGDRLVALAAEKYDKRAAAKMEAARKRGDILARQRAKTGASLTEQIESRPAASALKKQHKDWIARELAREVTPQEEEERRERHREWLDRLNRSEP
ncbi:MAG TPA: hypothetical protein V6D47_05975 [Oscillatoriaceae cyanobacterium]